MIDSGSPAFSGLGDGARSCSSFPVGITIYQHHVEAYLMYMMLGYNYIGKMLRMPTSCIGTAMFARLQSGLTCSYPERRQTFTQKQVNKETTILKPFGILLARFRKGRGINYLCKAIETPSVAELRIPCTQPVEDVWCYV